MLDFIAHGLLNLSFTGIVIYTLIVTQITIAAVTLYLHRSQAHRAVEFHPIINHFFRLWLWLTTGMTTKNWVAIHRKHHVHVEQEGDPHSPQILGLNKVLWEGAELYRDASKDRPSIERYGRGTPDDWLERHVYSHSRLGLIIMLFANMTLLGVAGVPVWGIQMMWIPFFAAGIINGVAHYIGYRNFETPDSSTNITPWAFFIGGEELHNNHHTYGSSAKFSMKWWEFDIGWAYITILKTIGLAKVLRIAPKLRSNPSKQNVDAESLGAVLAARFQVMDKYLRKVIYPVLRAEKRKAGRAGRTVFKSARKLLMKEPSKLVDGAKQSVDAMLAQSQSLQTVCRYRARLQDIWQRTTASQKELLDSLQEWCKQAEATGIQALQEFAASVRRFSLPQQAEVTTENSA